MEKVIGKTFQNTDVFLDYSDYEKCNFINCTIHTDSGIFRLVNCDFTNCRLDMGTQARNIALLIKLFYPDTPIWFEGQETKQQVLQRMKKKLQDEHII